MATKKTTKRRRAMDGKGTSKLAPLLDAVDEVRRYQLRLFITGTSPRSIQAIANIRSVCEEYLSGRYDLEVIDIYQQPAQAVDQQIVAAPTLIKELPYPVRRMVGDLSKRDRILVALNLQEVKA